MLRARASDAVADWMPTTSLPTAITSPAQL
jgi:hypothetical protein